ncbi:MAG: M1 family metallopeptidase [Thermaurantimonas sp.]
MSKEFVLAFFFYCFLVPTSAQDKSVCHPLDVRWAPRERIIDMHHLKLEIDPDPYKGLVKGKATLEFSTLYRPVDSIWLDAIRFEVSAIQLNGQAANFKNLDSGLVIFPEKLSADQVHILEITYSVYPSKGIYFTGWDDPTDQSRKQIWTQGQGIDHRHWIPYYDEQHDKLTTEVIISFDRHFRAISNGRLVAADTLRDKIRWHYLQDQPHPGYLIMIAIGDYIPVLSSLTTEGRVMEFEEYVYPEAAYAGESTYRHSRLFLQKFEELLNIPYPWPGPYRQIPVVDFIYGAMENTGAVIFGEVFLSDTNTEKFRNYHFVNAHEMAHQWFGNLVTAWSARHHWLHESFATYFDLLSNQWIEGDFEFSSKVRQAIARVVYQESQNSLPLAHSEAGTARHYQKGGVVLHMLRQWVGDEPFYRALKVFLERYRFRNAHTEDLLYCFHEVTGRNLQWFWDQWIYGSGMPGMKCTWSELSDRNSKKLMVIFDQENVYAPESSKVFRLIFNIEVKTTHRTMNVPVEIHSKTDTFFIPIDASEHVLMVNPDPGKLQLIDWIKIHDPNRNISRYASNSFDRLFVYRLSHSKFLESDIEFVQNESDISALSNWVDAFGRNVTKPNIWNFFSLIQDERVQFAILRHTDIHFWKNRPKNELIKFAESINPMVRAAAFIRLINAYPDKLLEYKRKFSIYESFTTQNERLQVAIAEAEILKTNESLMEVARFAGTKYMASVRIQAIDYLKRVNFVDESLIVICIHALGHYDRSLPVKAASYLKTIEDKRLKKRIKNELKKYRKIWPEWKYEKALKLLENF